MLLLTSINPRETFLSENFVLICRIKEYVQSFAFIVHNFRMAKTKFGPTVDTG